MYEHDQNKCKQNTQTGMKQQCLHLQRFRERGLQEHPPDRLPFDIKGKTKQATEPVKIQSVLCEDTLYVKKISWFENLRYKDLLNNCYCLRKYCL